MSRAILSQRVGVFIPKASGRHPCQMSLRQGRAMQRRFYGHDCNDEASDGSSVARRRGTPL